MGQSPTPDNMRVPKDPFAVPTMDEFIEGYSGVIRGVLARGGIRFAEREDAYQDVVTYFMTPAPSDGLTVLQRYDPKRGPFRRYILGMIKVRILQARKLDYSNTQEFRQLPVSEEDGEPIDVEDLYPDDPLEVIFNAELTGVLINTIRTLETYRKTPTMDYALLFKMALAQYGQTGKAINATALAEPYGMATEAHRPFTRQAINQQWEKLKRTPAMQRLYVIIGNRIKLQ